VIDMQPGRHAATVLGFPSDTEAARRLADRLQLDHEIIDIHRFPDGESLVRLPPKLPTQVILYCSLHHPNERLVELELAAATAMTLGAKRLCLVAPYLCYMRQDMAFQPGEAVSQRIIGDLLAQRFDTLLTVDPHLHRTHDLQEAVPVRLALALKATTPMAERLTERDDEPLLVGPDEESHQWVRAIAERAGLDFAVAKKQRLGDREVRIKLPDVPLKDRAVVLVDDIASSGQSLLVAARALLERGAGPVSVLVTHALFTGDALQALLQAGVRDVCSTDSIPHETNGMFLDHILAEALVEAWLE
jgi:ribose-phosphate pyrophosphokinase